MANENMDQMTSGSTELPNEPDTSTKNSDRGEALIKKYKAMAELRRDYEDIDIKDCIPTLEEMIQDDLMYEILESAANGETEEEVLSTAFYTEPLPVNTLGYDPEKNVFMLKINDLNISEADIALNRIDGDTFKVPISSLLGQLEPFTLNGTEYESFKDYCNKTGLGTDSIKVRLIGVDCPEIPHYEVQPMKEKDIVTMTLEEAKQKGAIVQNFDYSGTAAFDRDPDEKIKLYQVKSGSGGNAYYEIVGSGSSYVPSSERVSGYTYNKIVIKDESRKDSLVAGYNAQQNLINQLNNGGIYVMLDANGVTAEKTTSKYKLRYDHWWSVGNAVGDMIDQWNEYSAETGISRLTFKPYGTDAHGRFIGAAYSPSVDGMYTNIAKYNIADDSTMSSAGANSNSTEMNNLGGSNAAVFNLFSYEKNNQIWLDSFSEMTKESYNNRIEFHKEVTGLNFTALRNCTMMIGDTLFLIPPQSIRSMSSIDYERVGIMRGKGSMVKNQTNREMYVEVDLFFYNDAGINGIPTEVEMPNGTKLTYYMNGLRSLLAQFKLAPYLPIENQFINDVLGIEAVSLVNLTMSTVEGIPRLLRATLTMRDFNYRIYMPDIPIDYSYNQVSELAEMNPIFAKCINWEIFRYYYQRIILYGDSQKQYEYGSAEYNKELYSRKEALQPVYFCEKDGFGSSDISFYIPDENWLKGALEIAKQKDYSGQSLTPVELTTGGQEFFEKVAPMANYLKVNSTYAQRIADNCKVSFANVLPGNKVLTKKNVLSTKDSMIHYGGSTNTSNVKPGSASSVTIPSKTEDMLKGYKKLDVYGGDLSGTRQPNAVVDIGYGNREYYAFTNQYGQLVKVIAKKVELQKDSESVNSDGRYYDDQANVPGVEQDDLDKGHILADSLGGVANAYNITPQNSTLNREGEQWKIEDEIRKAGGCTDFVAVITYPDTKTQIPSHYSYAYTINGSRKTIDFKNEEPGTKPFNGETLTEDMLMEIANNISSCGMLSYDSVDEEFDIDAGIFTWKINFNLSSLLASDDIQYIREVLRDLTGLPFNSVLTGNKLVVSVSTSISNHTDISPAMDVKCAEISAIARHINGVDPAGDSEVYDYLNPAALPFVPYIENMELQNLSFSLTNNFSDITLKIMDGFAPQYMGSSDIAIEFSLISTDAQQVSMLNVLPAHASNIGKLYRRILSCWPIKVRNQYLQMAGVNEVLIDLIEVQTIPDFSGAFEIRVRMTSVDRTLRQRETMKQLESDKLTTTKASASMRSYWDLDNVLSTAELYPDLDLPSLKELSEYGFNFIRYRNSNRAYPDPDFYMNYAFPYTSYIIKKNLKDTFYNKIFHDQDKEKSELFDETSYEFFDQMGMTLYRKMDPYTGTTEAAGADGKTQNELADIFDKEMAVIDSSSEENIKKSQKSESEEIAENDCSDLTDLLIYLTACDVQDGWTLKPGYVAPVVINETNLAVEKLECSGVSGDAEQEGDAYNEYAQEVFNIRSDLIKAIDDYLSDPIDYGKYTVGEADVDILNVISLVVDEFSREEKAQTILKLLNPFDKELKLNGVVSPEMAYQEPSTLRFLIGFLHSAARSISGFITYDGKESFNEARQYRVYSDGNYYKDSDGHYIPTCKIERDGKASDHADSLKEALELGIQWGAFQIKRYRASELKKLLQPTSKVAYVSKEQMPMYKDPETGKERWHPGFIDPYYNIAGYKSEIGKEYIEKIATDFGVNTIAFIREVLMHLRRMVIDGQLISEIDVVAKDYEDITSVILDEHVTTGDKTEAFFQEAWDSAKDLITLPIDFVTGILSSPISYMGEVGMNLLSLPYDMTFGFADDVSTTAQLNSITEALGEDSQMAGTIQEMLKKLPETYGRSFCARLIYPVLMAVTYNNEMFNTLINSCQLNELNSITSGIVLSTSEPVSEITLFVKAMHSVGMMEFSKSETDPETTSDSQKLWNYIMKEAYTKLADDPQAYVLHSYYDMLINDKRGRLVRAFPTYYIIFVDEGRKIGSWKLFDNFYNMSAISELTVTKSRKIPADTCSFVMSNMYTSYAAEYDNSTKQQYIDVYGLRDVFHSIFSPMTYLKKEDSIRRRKEIGETTVLKPGVRIHVRMGYGADAANLPAVFNGKIAEIDVGDVVQVIAQGDGIELSNPLNTLGEIDAVELTEAQTWTTIFKDLRGSLKRGGESPRNLLTKLLTAQYGGVVKTVARAVSDSRWFGDNPFGIYHFGDQRFNYIFEEGECVQNLYEVCDATLLKGTNEIYTSEENIMATPTINCTLQDKTFWDILQLCAHSGVNYIGAVRDFGMRSTVCLCKPNHYYAYAYKKIDDEDGGTEGKIIERRKPFQQYHYYDSYTDIVYNSIKASEKNMKTNATGLWESTDLIWGRSQSTVGPVYLDFNIYPEHQRAMTVDTTLVSDGNGGLELNLFTHFAENWASSANDTKVNKALAERVTTNVLRESVSGMYCGELCVLGDTSVKPHDRFYINDYYEDMQGHMEVEGVVYSMNSATGFTTTIYPDLIVRTDDTHEPARQMVCGPFVGSLSLAVGGRLMMVNTFARLDSALIRTLSGLATKLATTNADEAAVQLGASTIGKLFSIQKGKSVKEAITLALKAGINISKILTTVVAAVAIYVVTNNVKSWLTSFLRNLQALTVYPITKNQRPLIAGMSGHRGSVYGYPYTEQDADDSIQGLIVNSVEWLDKYLPFDTGTFLMNSFTANTTDADGNTISEYERLKQKWAQTLPFDGEQAQEYRYYPGDTSLTTEERAEVLRRDLYDTTSKEFSARGSMIQALRTKYRIPNLLVSEEDKLADETYKKYNIQEVPSINAIATNKLILDLYPIEDDIDIKQATVKKSHPVVKQLHIAHSVGNAKVQIPFESGNRVIKFIAEQDGEKVIYDLPMLQEDALMILKLILNDQALKNKKVSFLSGTRVNDTATWKSTGFAFVIGCDNKGSLETALASVLESTTWLNGDKKQAIFEYKAVEDDNFLVIVYAPRHEQYTQATPKEETEEPVTSTTNTSNISNTNTDK